MKIPFHKPIINKNLDFILGDSINTGWLTTGPKVREFEEELSSIFGAWMHFGIEADMRAGAH